MGLQYRHSLYVKKISKTSFKTKAGCCTFHNNLHFGKMKTKDGHPDKELAETIIK